MEREVNELAGKPGSVALPGVCLLPFLSNRQRSIPGAVVNGSGQIGNITSLAGNMFTLLAHVNRLTY
ncbi:MAG: hypothetical protein Q7R50_01400 [Dehalococcoidales bacterium]|nr:hypothetical protein [Dehalococcoidales bacterium]